MFIKILKLEKRIIKIKIILTIYEIYTIFKLKATEIMFK